MRHRSQRLPQCLFFGCLLSLPCGQPVRSSASGTGPADFDLGREVANPLITVRYFGGLVFTAPTTTVFGDGRVVVQLARAGMNYASGSARLAQTFETQLSVTEREALLSDVISSGLLAFNETTLRARRESLKRSPPKVTDTPGIEIRLDFSPLAVDATAPDATDSSNRILIAAPRQLARAYPEIVEYAALYRLVQRIEALNRRALGKAPSNESE